MLAVAAGIAGVVYSLLLAAYGPDPEKFKFAALVADLPALPGIGLALLVELRRHPGFLTLVAYPSGNFVFYSSAAWILIGLARRSRHRPAEG
jgi:hypothetical protein